MDPQPQHDETAPRGGPLKFAYANGARPLAGYTIKRGIGRGGFGEVYFAISDGGKEVAIKLIRHNLDVELRGVTHCLNLKHPNLIALYDVKQDEQDNSWVVMEYAAGESLEEVIRRHPQGLPPEEAVNWMQGIAAGVGYLHDHGIVHRDLKPGNVFRDDGQVKLGDYGLSKFISCSRRSGQTESIGTVHYMAPEVANGRYGKEIDIYALGIILYEVLTGHVPFEGESVGEVLMKHLTAEPSLAEVPAAYREVIARALAKDPTRRFESAGEMMSALPPLAATMAYHPRLKETRGLDEAQAANAEYRVPPPPNPEPVQPDAAQPDAQQAHHLFTDEEPIWRAIRDGWRSTRESWDSFNTPTKIGAAVLGIIMISNDQVRTLVWSVGPVVVFLYIVYRIGRSVVLQHEARRQGGSPGDARRANFSTNYREAQRPPNPRPAEDPPRPQGDVKATAYHPTGNQYAPGDWRTASQRHWKRRSKRRWREEAAAALVVKSPRERMAELAGSMILAAAVGAAMSVVVVLLRGDAVEKEEYAWLTLVSVVGSWAIMIPSKFWEGTKGDAVLRRVALLIAGLAVGAIAYGAADVLMIKFSDSPLPHVIHARGLGNRFSDAKDGSPLLLAHLAYFGALFGVISWWRQANPLRRTRLSVWCTVGCVFWAWMIDLVWSFPQPWGLMVAAIISISVQLVSPFVPEHERLAKPAGQE
ncbi:MAG TPA: serine/threonine-protein kinase [Pirellulales bacterium]|nr:serine/threonine-protein kinase [Pirellulales bacterium]